jgi:hypothetical protein
MQYAPVSLRTNRGLYLLSGTSQSAVSKGALTLWQRQKLRLVGI